MSRRTRSSCSGGTEWCHIMLMSKAGRSAQAITSIRIWQRSGSIASHPAETPRPKNEIGREERLMRRFLGAVATAGLLLGGITASQPVLAQKSGGILRVPHFDSPASLSLHEESTVAANRPGMGIFNNLVLFKQDDPKNSMQAIAPELATGWNWNEDGTELTLQLRHGVKWHDGKPFTAAAVKCTWDLLTGKSVEKLRINPRKPWYANLAEVTTNGDFEVTFHLNRPQTSFL